jgi:hypothetical protein
LTQHAVSSGLQEFHQRLRDGLRLPDVQMVRAGKVFDADAGNAGGARLHER